MVGDGEEGGDASGATLAARLPSPLKDEVLERRYADSLRSGRHLSWHAHILMSINDLGWLVFLLNITGGKPEL